MQPLLFRLLNSESIISFAKEAIKTELEGLQRLHLSIDSTFEKVCTLIVQSKGRLIVTGIGKSAIIGQKIVATLNSTGQPSIFMHAADAIHGDLGIIQPGDVVLAISKSGNTPELKALVPYILNFGNTLVGMVGNMQSYLATSSAYVLDTTVEKEACPNNLAPTTSTTAQLVMGDALAIVLMKMRNFKETDFSKYHPGGALGKQMYLTVGQIASNNPKPIIKPDANLNTIISAISNGRVGATAVCENNKLLGIITDGDIRRALQNNIQLQQIEAKQIMHTSPVVMEHTTLAAEAMSIMQKRKISQIIVLNNTNYAGMVHAHDCAREGIL